MVGCPVWSTWIQSAAAHRAMSSPLSSIDGTPRVSGTSVRSPLAASTSTIVMGVRPSTTRSPLVSTPSRAIPSTTIRPGSSSPTRPTNATGMPSRASVTAAVAATPPPARWASFAGIRSPALGQPVDESDRVERRDADADDPGRHVGTSPRRSALAASPSSAMVRRISFGPAAAPASPSLRPAGSGRAGYGTS